MICNMASLPCTGLWEQELREGTRDNSILRAENADLKLELLLWRRKLSVYRLKLASVEEDLRLRTDNANVVNMQLQSVSEANQGLEARVAALSRGLGHTEDSSSAHRGRAEKLQASEGCRLPTTAWRTGTCSCRLSCSRACGFNSHQQDAGVAGAW